MSFPALLLLAVAIIQLVGPLFANAESWQRPFWLLTLVLVGWQLWHDSLLPSMVPLYLLLVILFLVFVIRQVRQGKSLGRKRPFFQALTSLLSLPFLAIPIIEAALIPINPDDFRHESWTAAFDETHATLQTNYAFGEWKAIDWDALYTKHRPKVAAAEQARNEQAYYVALRQYLYEIPDGHVGIDGEIHGAAETAVIGGGFGFAVLRLADGRVIAHIVEPYGAAERAGMAWGADMIAWDGQPIHEAVAAVPTLWTSRPPATMQNMSLAQHQLLTRAPIGTRRTLTFRNQGDAHTKTVTLTARRDNFRPYWKAVLGETAVFPQEPISHAILDNNIGYIQIAALEPTSGELSPVDAMDQAMEQLVRANVPALILDVRGNRGGLDTLIPPMMSYFTSTRLLYEGITTHNLLLNRSSKLLSLYVNPNELQFTKPVTILVDQRTKSSGEGFGLIAKSLPKVNIVGIRSTDGSFGMAGASILLPTGIEIVYPWGQSVDRDGVVQLDGDHQLVGGVQLDIAVPLTFETAESIYLRGNDVVLDFAHDFLQQQLVGQ